MALGGTLKMFSLLEETGPLKAQRPKDKRKRASRSAVVKARAKESSFDFDHETRHFQARCSTKVVGKFFVGHSTRSKKTPAFSFKGVSYAGRSIDLSSTQDRVFSAYEEAKGKGD